MSVRFHTQELKADEKLALMEYHNKYGWLLFAENPIPDSDIPKRQAEARGKSPSQRLRATIWVLHQQRGGKPETFEPFYIQCMERAINRVKDLLDD